MPEIPYGDFVEFIDNSGQKYFLARLGNVYTCTCKSWKEQAAPEHRRTCTHLQQYRGTKAEENRVEPNSTAKQSEKKITVRNLYVYDANSNTMEPTLDLLVEVLTELDLDARRADKYTKVPIVFFKEKRNAYLEIDYYRDPEKSNYTRGDPRPVVLIISKISFIQEGEEHEDLTSLVQKKLRALGFKPRV
jgi:hypothetical protein